ncbi:MAG: single-stranded DNA-binding protein [Chloroflexaceae bacterium]|nr:single-stranded DNA-binding protein [Chloroflexaceae bacterium]
MAKGLNRVQLIGRLGKDPEMRYTTQGKPVTTFSMATGDRWTDRDGNERDRTEWHLIETWDRLAEICNQYLTKGRQIYIEGRLKTDKWTDRDGGTRYTTKIVALDMMILDSKGDRDSSIAEPEDRGYSPNYEEYERSDPPPAAPPRRAESASPAGGSARNQPQPIGDTMNEDDIPF